MLGSARITLGARWGCTWDLTARCEHIGDVLWAYCGHAGGMLWVCKGDARS